MRDTSIEAYKEIIEGLPKKRLEVLAHIELRKDQGATLFELTGLMGRPVNEISGRVTELSKARLIVENGKRKNPTTGKSATVWILNTKEDAMGEPPALPLYLPQENT
jgi:predicted transcriptional regulator